MKLCWGDIIYGSCDVTSNWSDVDLRSIDESGGKKQKTEVTP